MTTPIPTEFRPNMSEGDQSNFFKGTDVTTQFKSENTIDISITTSDGLPTSVPLQNPTSYLTAKPHMLPLVYFQSQNQPAAPNSNVVFNTVQISNIGQNINNISTKNGNLTPSIPMPTNLSVQNNPVILSNPQQLVLQKQGVNPPIVPISLGGNASMKNTVALFTMLKPVSKTPDVMAAKRVQINSVNSNRSENIQIIPNMASINANPGQKYLLAPMPKISTNRLPITATTNCNLQSKIAFMPLCSNQDVNQKPKILNFKITNGQIQEDQPITVLCDAPSEAPNFDRQIERKENAETSLICTETIDLESPEKKSENEDKSYELSIVEDSSSRHDMTYSISIPEEDKSKDFSYKDTPKYPKQGISILKKGFSTLERKNNLIISPVLNTITTISDSSTKEVKITTVSTNDDDCVIVNPPKLISKPERRRKSNFCYRKEYDEIEVKPKLNWESKDKIQKLETNEVMLTKLNLADMEVKEEKPVVEDMIEIEVIKEHDADINDNFDESKVLNWESGVGTLPGSNLKFHMNEFGILEMIPEDDPQKFEDNRLMKKEHKIKKDDQEDIRCLECGCFGLPTEFINSSYCSYDCQDSAEKLKLKESKYKRKQKKNYCKKPFESMSNERDSGSDDDNVVNESSQDKLYPWNCSKKGFSWSKYLEHMKAKPAPTKLFKDPFPYNRNGFRVGMKLEGIDPQHPKYFCVLTVNEVLGYRIRLHFDGYPENYDYWVNADSMDIFPVGWCEKNGHRLHTPPNYTSEEFNWNNYLKQTRCTAAPKQLFAIRVPNHCPNAFRVGMKLEAVDRKNTSLVCVATIVDMMDNRILVHFDSWDDIYDYWAEPTSPYIHPVGWCDQHGHNLTPPNDYPSPETFTWESYLKETKSLAAPVRAFKQRPPNGFKKGMKLECVDKRVQHLIRVATIDEVKEHQIRIKFDGWPDKYSYWVDDDNIDIHPIGWCHKTGHPLEPPLTPDDVYDFLECATVGCRGQGHTKGPRFPTHTSPKYCPYADENLEMERTLPDRLLSPDREIQSVIPVSREPKEQPVRVRKVGRPPKIPRLDAAPVIKKEVTDPEDDSDYYDKPKRKYRKVKHVSAPVKTEPVKRNGFLNHTSPIESGIEIWEKHVKFLKQFITVRSDPRRWSQQEVVDFIKNIPGCHREGDQFIANKIDGDSMLMLTQEDLVRVLDLNIGPAVKLYNSILLLRQNILKGYT